MEAALPGVTCISSVLCRVRAPGGFIVVPEAWPSSLIAVLDLSLPLWAAYFSVKLHGYFNSSKCKVDQWFAPQEFCGPVHNDRAIYLLSGSADFLRKILTLLPDCQQLIVTVEWTHHAALRPGLSRALKAGHDLLESFRLALLVVADSMVGGATDGQYLLGFGLDLGSSASPTVEPGLPHTLRHFLDGGTEGCFPSVLKSSLLALS